jgi:hypothetical protein
MLLKLGAASTHATLNDNRFETNEASIGGALFIDDASEVRAARSSFIGNVALEAGAVRTRDSGRLLCVQCRFIANEAATGAALALIGPKSGPRVQHQLSGAINDNPCVAANPLDQFGTVLLAGLCVFFSLVVMFVPILIVDICIACACVYVCFV